MISTTINGKAVQLDVEEDMPLLWALRDELGLTGSKFGCGAGHCGACTILIDQQAARSCLTPIAAAQGKEITTIEGLGEDRLSEIQAAWVKYNVPQCGYCQSGQIMAATALQRTKEVVNQKDLELALAPHLCRCGTYPRIEKALKEVFLSKGENHGD